jgi:hypothetical protein
VFYLIILRFILSCTKIIFDQLHKLSFIFWKFSILNFFPFFSFLFLLLSPSSFLLPVFLSRTERMSGSSTDSGAATELLHSSPSPWRPQVMPPSPLPFSLSPLFGELPHDWPWSSNSGHGCLPWRALTKDIFPRGTTKNDAHDRVGLAQLVRFLVVELTHPGSNLRFDMGIVFTANYSFSGRRRPHRQRDTLADRLRESQDQAGLVFQRCS